MRTGMFRRSVAFTVCGIVTGLALWPRPAGAEHFDITLRVSAPNSHGEAFMDTSPPIGGVNKRPLVKAKPGEMVRITWKMKNASPHGVLKNVTIHFFVVKEAEIGQKPTPDPSGEAGIVDNSVTQDLAPKSGVNGSLRLKAPEAGNYLIRVQSEDTNEEFGHEHFSAIDLQVQP